MSSSEFLYIYEKALRKNDEEGAELLLWARCATDIELFSATYFAHYCEKPFNRFHLDLFKSFKYGERKVRRVRAAPRGSAKSTIATLIKPIHDVCYGLEKFILFVSSTEPLACKKLKDIRAEIENNYDLRRAYGVRFPNKNPSETEFTIISNADECHYVALGKGSQVRGIRYKQHRPSKIVFDDFEVSEEANNERLRKKTEDIFLEEFGKTGNTQTNIEFVGTVLHKEALLPKLLKKPSYDGKLYKAVISWSSREDLWNKWREIYNNIDNPNRVIDSDAYYEQNREAMLEGSEVLWPENEDYLAHMKDLVEIGRRAFMKEKQNSPLGTDEPVFEKIHFYREVAEGFQLESGPLVKWSELECIGAIDPSTGQTKPKKGKLGDWTVILTGYKDLKGRVFVHHDFTKRVPPTKFIEETFNLHEKFKYQKFAVETNLYRNLLLPNMVEERKRREQATGKLLKIPFYDVVQTENKHERIFRLEPKVSHGWMVFNRALSNEFMLQLEDFPHAENDDAPDCLEILWSLANNRYKAAGVSIDAMSIG